MTALTAIESYVASHEIEKSRAATLSSARLTSMTPELWGVILAGGEGIRLRLSRASSAATSGPSNT
jgi:hypothetical protein